MKFTVPCQITVSTWNSHLAKEKVRSMLRYYSLFYREFGFTIGEPVPKEDTTDGGQDRGSESSVPSKGN
jgi:hypothetical protein